MNTIKTAQTSTPVLSVIRERWSARAFDGKAPERGVMETLFEAASWAASANNAQPWSYVYALAGTPAFDTLWSMLAGGNQPWCKNAGALVVSIAHHLMAPDKPNSWALHDLGMANAHLLLQATAEGLHAHPMAGFNKAAVAAWLELPADQEPVCMIALGTITDADTLEEPFRTRELTPRTRKPVGELVREL
jgi:nitroreductase